MPGVSSLPVAVSAVRFSGVSIDTWCNLAYLVASVLFILGLKGLGHPKRAVRGNWLGALGMALAIGVTLWKLYTYNRMPLFWAVLVGMGVGSLVGWLLAVRVKMTGMPQMVALLNGFGGLASVLVAGADVATSLQPSLQGNIAVALSGLIGAVTFTGSVLAYAKLEEYKFLKKLAALPGKQVFNVVCGAVAIALSVWLVVESQTRDHPEQYDYIYTILCVVSAVLGVGLVLPIGGADMPVVIALLNSYSGLAAAATGFVIDNDVLIIAGALVGASGIILTQIMCKAMNRSLMNVLLGLMDSGGSAADADSVYAGKIKSTTADEIAMICDGARRVVIVPGYGLAVAQAQHAVRELTSVLEARGTEVLFAIHPVAGRMPGHMNVLLAEAEIPYDKLKEMDEINPQFAETDVAIVIGANDVVNPVARIDPKSPIAGMPILDVDKARTVIMVKRSLSPGFAGIPNPLFAADNCLMYFADGKQAVLDIVTAIKSG
ncbi:MAG: NAD synthetase [Planctomycetota bacterium]|nr:MAG: NAD synthetase [Planctomycetota bacterium]